MTGCQADDTNLLYHLVFGLSKHLLTFSPDGPDSLTGGSMTTGSNTETQEVNTSSGPPSGLVITEQEAAWLTFLTVGLVTKMSFWHTASHISPLGVFQGRMTSVTS